ncbi:MAG: TonB-dependent receptor [Candidatus Kapaibacteriales bacterium]
MKTSFFIFISLFAFADSFSGSITGFVRDSVTRETVIGASVYIPSLEKGAVTNSNGYYSILGLPAGKYDVVTRSVSYAMDTVQVTIAEDEARRLDIELDVDGTTTDEIVVEATRDSDKSQIEISKVNIPVEQVKKIRIGGESDVFRTLQLLPGVLTSSQISSGLFVRGGSPDQNLVLLDGSTVYNPSHLFGFISTFNSDAIKDVELIKGGFPAEYGGRMSSVLNITQKDGNQSEVDGMASVGVISTKASVEGPLGNGSFFLGGRRTYFELVKAALGNSTDINIPDFGFYDLNGKITQNFGDKDKVSISGFISNDLLEAQDRGVQFGLEVGNRLGAARWTHIFDNNFFLETNLSYSKYETRFGGDNSGFEFLINNQIEDVTLRSGLEWQALENLTAKTGIEVTGYQFGYLQDFDGETEDNVGSTENQEEENFGELALSIRDYNYSGYLQANYQPTPLLFLQAGLRGSLWDAAETATIDPRLAVKYQLFEDVALKAAWGLFHQNLKLATLPDFTFFDTWLPSDTTVDISRATHYIFSIETTPFEGYALNFDVYYKYLENLSELNTIQIELGTNTADYFYQGIGEAYGFEVFFQKKYGQFSGWVGYALGFVEAEFDEINFGEPFRPKWDRRHDLKIVGNYTLDESWDFGATFIFQSGQSYTGASSFWYSRLPGDIKGLPRIFPTQRWGLRLPPSHQLNLYASYGFDLAEGWPAKIILDVFNVYNRSDVWFRRFVEEENSIVSEDFLLLPVLPTLSFEVRF